VQDEDLDKLVYPLVASPKLDGFRCTVVNGSPLTSSMKPFMNRFICEEFANYPWLSGLDGEIIVGPPNTPDAFHNTSGPVRRFDGEPDFKFYVFDNFSNKSLTYDERWLLKNHLYSWSRVVVLPQSLLKNPDDVKEYERIMLESGYEGAMIRSLNGRYKEGRCTFKEMNIFKRKPFVECEAVIIGFEEALENQNEQEVNELGLSKRSHKQENMIPKGTLGAFILRSPLWEHSFSAAPGKGFTAADRLQIWTVRQSLLGRPATVKYQKYGSRERPRMPSVIKLRPLWDLSEE
jgi:DNA ligase-1